MSGMVRKSLIETLSSSSVHIFFIRNGSLVQNPEFLRPKDFPPKEKPERDSGAPDNGIERKSYPETSLTISLTNAVRLLKWPLVREIRGLASRGVVF